MHIRAQRFQAFLVLDAEFLFLINDKQAKVAEFDRLGQQRVGADHDIDGAIRQPLAGSGGVFGRHKARQGPHDDGKAAETLCKALIMLAGQQGCRGHDGDLHAGQRGDKGGTDRDLCLTKPDVAADQAIHRLAAFQIGQHIVNRRQLVVSFRIRKARKELIPDAVHRL